MHFPSGESFEGVLVPLINELAKVLETFLLVLDDYHTIHAQSIHDALAFLIENLPPNVHIFMATRADPPLPIARLGDWLAWLCVVGLMTTRCRRFYTVHHPEIDQIVFTIPNQKPFS